ncbi:MAG: hypothetical protein WBA74_26475 [Cyclobacteriaceae bacterium]
MNFTLEAEQYLNRFTFNSMEGDGGRGGCGGMAGRGGQGGEGEPAGRNGEDGRSGNSGRWGPDGFRGNIFYRVIFGKNESVE